jgi:hypothetical protein
VAFVPALIDNLIQPEKINILHYLAYENNEEAIKECIKY